MVHSYTNLYFCVPLTMKRNDILKKEAEIRQWIAEHRSKAFICRQLHCKPETLESYLSKLGIVYKGNKGGKGHKSAQIKPAIAYLYRGSNIKSHELKLKLIRDGIKIAKCESCKLSNWFDKEIPLELHHINSDRFDNRLDNLQILCPNCHALTNNYRAKAIKRSNQFVNSTEALQLIEEEKNNSSPVSVFVFDRPENYLKWKEENQAIQQL